MAANGSRKKLLLTKNVHLFVLSKMERIIDNKSANINGKN